MRTADGTSWTAPPTASPAAAAVSEYGLVAPAGASYVDPWPSDPYAGGAMTSGRGEGQFLYVPSPARDSYTLTAYGRDGALLITLP